MSISSRFAVGVHTLTILARSAGKPVTSEWIAASANTNPAVIRRILGMLAKAGLTSSQLGVGGGALIARAPTDISLLEVYKAVEEGELFSLHHEPPSAKCMVGRNILTALTGCTERAQHALEAELGGRTIADIVQEVSSCEASKQACQVQEAGAGA